MHFKLEIRFQGQNYHKYTNSKNDINSPLFLMLRDLWLINCFQDFSTRIMREEFYWIFCILDITLQICSIHFNSQKYLIFPFFYHIGNLNTFARFTNFRISLYYLQRDFKYFFHLFKSDKLLLFISTGNLNTSARDSKNSGFSFFLYRMNYTWREAQRVLRLFLEWCDKGLHSKSQLLFKI